MNPTEYQYKLYNEYDGLQLQGNCLAECVQGYLECNLIRHSNLLDKTIRLEIKDTKNNCTFVVLVTSDSYQVLFPKEMILHS
jgi:hypothetical protein